MTSSSLAVLSILAIGTSMSPDARARYTQASQDIQARNYGPAIEKLNQLATEYPKVAEIFASRCSALIANAQYEHAEADCKYALSLKALQPEALYALAVAEDHLNKRKEAAEHYRKYATLDGVPYQEQALQRAAVLSGAPPPPPPPPGSAPSAAPTNQGAPVGGVSGGTMGRLVVYRNHRFAGSGPMALIVDGHLLGDIEYGTYVELEVYSGSHMFEARNKNYDPYDGQRSWSQPVQVPAGGAVYMNFDTNGGHIVLQEVQGRQARQELADDCQKGWALRGPFDNLPMAGPVAGPRAPAVVVVPGGGYYAPAPSGGSYCHSSIDCGAGAFCKDRGDGVRMCMGSGGRGEFCNSSIDCGGGLFCKDRGDGLRSCM